MSRLKHFNTWSSFWIKISLIILLFYFQNRLFAQVEGLQFDETTFDFGIIPIASANNIAVFKYIYNGNNPLTITNVSTSCGCSTPIWSKTPIKKGEKGEVIVNYNSKNKMGVFSEKFLVTTNISSKAYQLEIKGKVDEVLTNLYKSYSNSVELGIRVQNSNLKYGYIYENKSDTLSLKLYNSSAEIRTLKLAGLPKYLKLVGNSKLELKAGGIDSFRIVLNAPKAKSLGLIKGQFNILVDKTKNTTYNNTIYFTAYIKKDISQLTKEQLDNAPKIEIAPSVIKLAKVESKNEYSGMVKIKNEGKTALKIINVKSNNALLKLTVNRKSIAAGKESQLTIKYPDDYQKYNGQDIIYITSSDPKSPVTTISILKE
jgi:hypothetical protein